jgi:hypothetical protein
LRCAPRPRTWGPGRQCFREAPRPR